VIAAAFIREERVMNSKGRHEFDVGPAGEMQRKYGWYAENRPVIVVNRDEVPPHLQDLIPYVERWAISCDVTRCDYFEKTPEEDIRAFARAVAPRSDEINDWLDTFPKDAKLWPMAAIYFLSLQTAVCDALCWFGPNDEEMKRLIFG
jgi:hypothetical protein